MKQSLLLLTALVFQLVGCSALHAPETGDASRYAQALVGRTPVYNWRAKGRMHFVCTYDGKGLYWRFERPSGNLYADNGRLEGRLNADWSITARDGSHLPARILLNGPTGSQSDLRDAVFESDPPAKGILARVVRIERKHAKGGMPLTKCSASQRGQRLQVPFEARWILLR